MKKYKINYKSNNKVLSTLYVKSDTYPKIPNFDNQKFFILEQLQTQVADLIIIDVILAQKIDIDTLDVFYNNELIGKTKIIKNNASSNVMLENSFFSEKYLEEELKINDKNEFYGINAQVGNEIEFVINKDNNKLFINEEKIEFEHTTGDVYLDENQKLVGLIPDPGYVITKLELLENNVIDFEIKQTGTLHKQDVLKELQNEFMQEEFVKTNKLLINELLEKDKKILSAKNLDYFKTQIKQSDNLKKFEKQAKFNSEVSKELEKQITSLITDVIEEVKKETEDNQIIENKHPKKITLFKKIFKTRK